MLPSLRLLVGGAWPFRAAAEHLLTVPELLGTHPPCFQPLHLDRPFSISSPALAGRSRSKPRSNAEPVVDDDVRSESPAPPTPAPSRRKRATAKQQQDSPTPPSGAPNNDTMSTLISTLASLQLNDGREKLTLLTDQERLILAAVKQVLAQPNSTLAPSPPLPSTSSPASSSSSSSSHHSPPRRKAVVHNDPLNDTYLRQWASSSSVERLQPGDLDVQITSTPISEADYTLEEFYRNVFASKRATRVSAATWYREQGYWRRIIQYLGHYKLRQLNGAIWDDYLDTLDSGNYKRLNQAAYISLLKTAQLRGIIGGIHPFQKIKGSGTTVLEVSPFSVDEVKILLDFAPSSMHRAVYATCIGQGLRPSEVCRLRWEDIDWQQSMMRVRGTKTVNSNSAIPMTPFTIKELQAFANSIGMPKTGHCFTWAGKPIGTIHQTLQRTCQRAGLAGGRRVHANMLRHTFATLAAYYGVPLPVAQQIMRHSSPRMLLGVYAKAGRFTTSSGLNNFPLT